MLGLSQIVRQMRVVNERHGLDFASIAVLFTVAHHGDGVRISEVAAEVHLDLSTVSRHVRALQDRGHLAKACDPQDRRASLVTITDTGGSALRHVMQQRSNLFADATRAWSPAELALLADLLARLHASLADHLQPSGATA